MSRYDDRVKDKESSSGMISMAIVLIGLAGGGWFYFQHLQSEAVTEPETRMLALPLDSRDMKAADPLFISNGASTAGAPPGIVTDTIIEPSFILPDLDHSDALLREEIVRVSPALAGWLNADQLIRKYVVIANDFSQGLRLEKNLRFLQLDQPFAVDQEGESLFISSKTYQRYDGLAAAINALDVQATLSVYKKFRPLLVQVFKEFSYPEEYGLEDIMMKAAAVILAAPVRDERIALEKGSAHYKFADQQLEALNPVHKQMLRMGPENTRIIQNKLRVFVESLANLKE